MVNAASNLGGYFQASLEADHVNEQGHAAATAAIAALTGQPVPPWIVLPGLSVTAANAVEAYRTVGGEPASPALMADADT